STAAHVRRRCTRARRVPDRSGRVTRTRGPAQPTAWGALRAAGAESAIPRISEAGGVLGAVTRSVLDRDRRPLSPGP
ncbi:hypothetical protein, partial [Nocardiopsis lucentensis]|uniref:hypothetical protein n=1 Tax=Nocardiopsis lucentensis TaxID=53441 RepID=UPI0019D3AA34